MTPSVPSLPQETEAPAITGLHDAAPEPCALPLPVYYDRTPQGTEARAPQGTEATAQPVVLPGSEATEENSAYWNAGYTAGLEVGRRPLDPMYERAAEIVKRAAAALESASLPEATAQPADKEPK